jgi:hypothetical protein
VFKALLFQQFLRRIGLDLDYWLSEVREVKKCGVPATEKVNQVGRGKYGAIFLGEHDTPPTLAQVVNFSVGAPGQRYAFESVNNALALGVRRIEIVSGLLLLLAAASNCRNAATALRA